MPPGRPGAANAGSRCMPSTRPAPESRRMAIGRLLSASSTAEPPGPLRVILASAVAHAGCADRAKAKLERPPPVLQMGHPRRDGGTQFPNAPVSQCRQRTSAAVEEKSCHFDGIFPQLRWPAGERHRPIYWWLSARRRPASSVKRTVSGRVRDPSSGLGPADVALTVFGGSETSRQPPRADQSAGSRPRRAEPYSAFLSGIESRTSMRLPERSPGAGDRKSVV